MTRNRQDGQSLWRIAALVGLVAVPLILLVVNGLLAREFHASRTLRAALDRSFETRALLMEVLSLHQDIETGQRGYVLTQNEDFLEPFTKARNSLDRSTARLDADVGAESPIAPFLPDVRSLSRLKIAISDRNIAWTRAGERDRAVDSIASGQGRRVMDALRAVIANMDRIERDRLAARSAAAEEGRVRLQRTTFALQALLALLLALAVWITGRSMAARRKALERIEDLSRRQSAIFDSATDGMLTLNPSGSIETLNPAAARMYGYSVADLQRRDVGLLFEAAPDRGRVETFLRRLAANRSFGQIQEFWARRRDGSTFPVDVTISPVPLADGMRYVAVMRDATVRKQVDQLKSEFVSTVSHELRTPLTSIAGSLGLLAGGAAGSLPERAARLVSIAHANCERLVRLINDILDIEKIESGQVRFDIKPLALQPLIATTLEANRAIADAAEVSLRIGSTAADAVVLADHDRLVQVVTNLVSNAIKFSPPGGVVDVEVAPLDRRFRLCVSDRGPGIPDAFRSRIFDKFAQADSSDTRQKGGTGLGLSIVREIAHRLGGSAGFEDREGGGTTFYVDIPAAAAQPVDRATVLPTRTAHAGLPLVLHVDDDPDMLRVVASVLEARAAVHSTPSVAEARAAIRRFDFDVAILDIGMEDGSGLDLLADLRSAGSAVIVFTAQDADRSVADRVDSLLVKSRASLDDLASTVLALGAGKKRTP